MKYPTFAMKRLAADILARRRPDRSLRLREDILDARPYLVDERRRLISTKRNLGQESSEDWDALQGAISRHLLDSFYKARGVGSSDLEFVLFVGRQLARYREEVKAQLFQDCWALFETDERKEGFFVEFGAYDGVQLSNTYLLEKMFGWNGILAEPDPRLAESIRMSRRAELYSGCVWSTSGEELTLRLAGALSTLEPYLSTDRHATAREATRDEAIVPSISLADLLKRFNAPQIIDFMSVDTEGSELEILKAFDFKDYDIRLICVEHNDTSNKEALDVLLSAQGYVRRFESMSAWDSWYSRTTEGDRRRVGK